MASTHAQWPSWNSPLGDNRPHFLHPNDFQFAGFLRVGVPVGTDNGVVWWNEGGEDGGRQHLVCIICSFHRLTSTLDLSVSLKAGFALADVLGGKIAALSVVHTLASQLRDLALVDIWKETMLLNVCMLCCTILAVNMLRYQTTLSAINPG